VATSAEKTDDQRLLTFSELTQLERARELVGAIQRLSLARSIAEIQEIVRSAARWLTGADGATFVLRDGTRCYYADEDAVSPLWKGQRFPMSSCISGWAMLNRRPAVIEDIYADSRIPHDAYRPTFVKSLLMVPIRTLDPVGAIGNYWATQHGPTEEEIELLQALADSTAVAMENVRVYEELEQRVADRTAELHARTRELEDTNGTIRALYDEATASFEALRERNGHHLQVLHTLAHEVRTPLAAGQGILRLVLREDPGLDEGRREDLADVGAALAEAIDVVNRQLETARHDAGPGPLRPERVELADELGALRAMFRALVRSEDVALVVEDPEDGLELVTDRALLGHVLRNLVGNALKFTDAGEVRVSARRSPTPGMAVTLTISDTGIGIAPADLERVFEEWQQVNGAQANRPTGSGLGLPLVRRLVETLGGGMRVTSEPGRGSAFIVELPASDAPDAR
jgi:two-component system CheB/CheR fusion protein